MLMERRFNVCETLTYSVQRMAHFVCVWTPYWTIPRMPQMIKIVESRYNDQQSLISPARNALGLRGTLYMRS